MVMINLPPILDATCFYVMDLQLGEVSKRLNPDIWLLGCHKDWIWVLQRVTSLTRLR